MNLYVLNYNLDNNESFPEYLIEDIISFKWVERHYSVGEFELTVPWSREYRQWLGIGNFLWNDRSTRIMRIQSYEVSNENGLEIKVKGKSLEDIYRYRIALWLFPDGINYGGIDSIRDMPSYRWSDSTYAAAIPMDMVRRYLYWALPTDTHRQRSLQGIINTNRGPYPNRSQSILMDGMTDGYFELPYGNLMTVLTSVVGSGYAGLPALLRMPNSGELALYSNIGVDLTEGVDAIFFDELPNSRKLIEESEFYNGALVADDVKVLVYQPPSNVSGIDSRYTDLFLGKPEQGDTRTDSQRRSAARDTLREHERKALIDLTLSDDDTDVPYEYDVDYRLGDKVLAKDIEGDLVNLRLVEYSWFIERDGSRKQVPTFMYVEE